MSFNNFKMAVNRQIDRMLGSNAELFYVDVGRDDLVNLYLASFPEGTDPIFQTRTVHNCSCCKKFIRDFGHVVAFINGRLESIWDIFTGDFYREIAKTLSMDVKSRTIAGIYRTREKTLGGRSNKGTLANGESRTFDHLHYILPSRFITSSIATFQGKTRTNKDLLERSLTEISLEAIKDVVDLIDSNSLYRGEEFLHLVKKLRTIKYEFDRVPTENREMFLWTTSVELKEAGRFKNTVIGTLLHDLSTGTPLEDAVRMFESKVAPTNYKRTTALITQAMIDRAAAKIEELGIEKSLSRRFATVKDLTKNNVIFAVSDVKKKLKGKKRKSILSELEPTKTLDPKKIQKMNIDQFVATILPHVDHVEVMVQNTHVNNLMSLIGPKNPRSESILQWNNPVTWSYNNDVTDSIKERVKKAGGNVTGFMRFSLSWHYYDDLDIHVIEPNGNEIFYGRKRSPSGGFLDVDMNVQDRHSLEPVENIAWQNGNRIPEGRYTVLVENFCKRNMSASGFQVQMEIDGNISLFEYDKPLRQTERVIVMQFDYKRSTGLKIVKSLPVSTVSKEVWGINTHEWTKVKMIMNSPNHWNGEQIGNKHFFFILENCLNPDKARGFYNEFLRNDLREHRKVFEVLSSKMKVEPSDDQLSGVGFSSTQENSILCRVSGKFDKTLMLTFANITGRFGGKPTGLTGETVALCEVCKRDVTDLDSRLPCHSCGLIFHTAHYLESVRVFGKCPVCKEVVTQIHVDQAVQLATV